MPQSYTNLLYHIIFSTKDRRPFVTSEYESGCMITSAAPFGGWGAPVLESKWNRVRRAVFTMMLSPAARAIDFCVSLTWGSASLHPRLYAVARYAGSVPHSGAAGIRRGGPCPYNPASQETKGLLLKSSQVN